VAKKLICDVCDSEIKEVNGYMETNKGVLEVYGKNAKPKNKKYGYENFDLCGTCLVRICDLIEDIRRN